MKQLRTIVDICSQIQTAGTVREICQTGIRLIKECLYYERVSICLNETPLDHAGSFYGFYGLDQPIETREQSNRITEAAAACGQTAEICQNVELMDLQGTVLGLADCLCVSITAADGHPLGYLMADNFADKKPLKENSIEVFRIFSIFFANIFSIKEAEVRRKREIIQMETLIDSLPACIYIKDSESRFLLANKKLAEGMHEESPEDMLGKTDFDYYPKHLAQKIYDEEQELIQSGESLSNIKEKGRSPDGGEAWFLTTKIPLKNEQGTVFSLVGIGLDITQQVTHEEALIRARQEAEKNTAIIRTIFDNLEDRIYYKDRQSRILGGNKAWLKAKESSSLDKVIGKTDIDFFPAPLGQQLYDKEQEQMAEGKVTRMRESHVSPAGETRYVEAIKCPIYNEKDEVIGVAGISRDITQQVENEQLLIIAKQRAEEAEKAAENAARAKSTFLANMSHEIRTPLNAVIGMTSLLADSPMSLEQRDFVETIQTSGDALLTLVNDILDLSKIEAGRLELESVPFNLTHCVETALDIVAPKAAEKGLELAYSTTGDIPQIFVGDAPRLRQVLLNLLSNSIKFTEVGEVIVRIAGNAFDETKYRINFSVTDTGIGMNTETAKKIFQPFEQADASTTRKYGGTGLGLSICKKLIEMMGGDIDVHSDLKKGSEFKFHILLKPASNNEEARTRINLNVLQGQRILVVDDNKTNLRILEYQLKKWKMIPLVFTSGQDALTHLSSLGKLDMAVLDMMMPDMDGEMLAENLRKRIEFSNLPILILSSITHRVSHDKQVADDWLCKPVKPEFLMEALANLVEHKTTERLTHPQEIQVNHTLGLTNPLEILLAEDNQVNQKVALKMLERVGYKADLVKNGCEVLEAVERKHYDLILMDIQMPIMDGIEATMELRKRYLPENSPKIVAMTAHALQESRDEGMTCGMFDYLTKPVRLEDLIEILQKVSPGKQT
ncbi:MAG: response regulator [Kiritimatiellales bacterium]|nr:response regulator [Kiritimatiellales bacterium]